MILILECSCSNCFGSDVIAVGENNDAAFVDAFSQCHSIGKLDVPEKVNHGVFDLYALLLSSTQDKSTALDLNFALRRDNLALLLFVELTGQISIKINGHRLAFILSPAHASGQGLFVESDSFQCRNVRSHGCVG